MSRLLPAIADRPDFHRERSRPVADWLPALRHIAALHGLDAAAAVRFGRGESPVFGLGAHVVKFLPGFLATPAQQEIDLLTFLASHDDPPAPRLVAHGRLEEWIYLVMTRIDGTLLHEVWPGVPTEQRAGLAFACGRALATLHVLPPSATDPAGIDWVEFCRSSTERWLHRPSVQRLPPHLQADGAQYFQAHGDAVAKAPRVMLHGDLAPENLLVRSVNGRWEIAGLIDFGNAMRGDPWFDLTAASILLQPGDRAIVHAMLNGYAPYAGTRLADLRPRLMVNTLFHPLGDIAACLDLVPGSAECRTWDEVARQFWPD